jgi:hypothetical protein
MNVVCYNCSKDMNKIRCGMTVRFGSCARSGDLYECPECGHVVISDFGGLYLLNETTRVDFEVIT